MTATAESAETLSEQETVSSETPIDTELMLYTDQNGDTACIPADFTVSEKTNEQTIHTGLVVIGPDGSEFVWIPTTGTPLAVREFGSCFSGGTIAENPRRDRTGKLPGDARECREIRRLLYGKI